MRKGRRHPKFVKALGRWDKIPTHTQLLIAKINQQIDHETQHGPVRVIFSKPQAPIGGDAVSA